MDVSEVLLHILAVLVAAKIAAEVAERLSVPPVLGEILAGILIGPSVFGLVGSDDVVRVLGELGVILLLLQVGLEMDLGELGSVGAAALRVATVGVVVPFAAGMGAGLAFGMDSNEALFVGAALTATSVGITARVFGDLRVLTSIEARIVLGAAVADDVMGLVILTVVTRIATQGSVSLASLAWIILVAVGFLVVATAVGIRLVPPLFAAIGRHSRSAGTLVALALAFTLAVAELADAAKLAPIVGAFVAGLVLGRSPTAERVRRELLPVSHLLVPVFFLQIGIDAEVSQFAHPKVLALAGVLLVVAVLGKLAAAWGLGRSPGDRLTVGVGMIPRGEVGLIFATLGLRQGVFGEDVYAALLLVVLVTTVVTPPALRQRLLALRRRQHEVAPRASSAPAVGWFVERNGLVELVGTPASAEVLDVALEGALRCAVMPPGESLLTWLAELPGGALRWNRAARAHFGSLLQDGTARSWRLLTVSGVLQRALPELGAAIERREHDELLDPLAALAWPTLARLEPPSRDGRVPHPERVRLAALVLDVMDGPSPAAVVVARKTCQRLDLGAAAEQEVAALVTDANLLVGAARRIDGLGEEAVLQLAAHLETPGRAAALYVLTQARHELAAIDRSRLGTLYELVQDALAHPELVGREAVNTLERRRREIAVDVAGSVDGLERVEHAPRAYLLRVPPSDVARHVRLCDPIPPAGSLRVGVSPVLARAGWWNVDVVALDQPGLLARHTGVLARFGARIEDAVAATWGDRCALASFRLWLPGAPDSEELRAALEHELSAPLAADPHPDIVLGFDDEASPWHTLATAAAPDHNGLLHAIATVLAAGGADIHAGRVHADAGRATCVFEVTNRRGSKLTATDEAAILALVEQGVAPASRRRGRAHVRAARPR